MNIGVNESISLASAIYQALRQSPPKMNCEIVIAPSFPALYPISQILDTTFVSLAAQNCFWEEQGAFTGEVSAKQLKELGCRYVLIGHSERRKLFGETDQHIHQKIQRVFTEQMKPILCVGETREEHMKDQTFKTLISQLEKGLHGLQNDQICQLVLAYEPVWAIGTGSPATSDWVEKIHAFLHQWVKNKLGPLAQSVRIVYGGSVNELQAQEIFKKSHVNGVLVGSASLSADSFLRIIRSCEAVV